MNAVTHGGIRFEENKISDNSQFTAQDQSPTIALERNSTSLRKPAVNPTNTSPLQDDKDRELEEEIK